MRSLRVWPCGWLRLGWAAALCLACLSAQAASGALQCAQRPTQARVTGAPEAAAAALPPIALSYLDMSMLAASHRLAPWPPDGSAQAQADIDAVLREQATRAASDLAEARLDANRGPLPWAQDVAALGPAFDPARLPRTMALLLAVNDDVRAVNRAANAACGWRLRPQQVNAQVQPGIALGRIDTPSYPSARATSSAVWALLLSQLWPDRRAALQAQAARTAHLRVLAGLHFPSDIEASQALATAVWRILQRNPVFVAELNAARREVRAAQAPALP